MPNSLPELEAERSQILGQFTTLGDLRPVRSARFLAAAENRLAIAPNPMTQGTIRKFDGHVKSQEEPSLNRFLLPPPVGRLSPQSMSTIASRN